MPERGQGAGELQQMVLAWLKDAHRRAEAAAMARREAVQLARDFGLSWDAIGIAMGMSRQMAHKRFGQGATEPDRDTVHRVERLMELADTPMDAEDESDEGA